MKKTTLHILVAVWIFANHLSAASLFYGWGDYPAGNNLSGVQVWNDTLGYSFQVGAQNLQVFRIWDMDVSNYTSAGSPDKVGIWDSNGNLLASSTFTSYSENSKYLGGAYLAAPITLLSGQTYTIGTQGNFQYRKVVDLSYFPNYINNYASPDATYLTAVRNGNGYSFSFPTQTFSSQAFVGSYLEYNVVAVPEPSTYALLGLGLITLLVTRKRGIC